MMHRFILIGALAMLNGSSALATTVNIQGLPADAVLVAQTPTTDTFRSQGYDITTTVDRQFGAPGLRGAPQGIPAQWFVDAQGVTQAAALTLTRVDGEPFDLSMLALALQTSTGGAGLDFEVVPSLRGQDGPSSFFTGTGGAGQVFRFDETGAPSVENPYGQNTRALMGYDRYQINFTFDFGLVGATLVDASAPVPEPAPWGLLLAGLAVIRLQKRRSLQY